LGAAIAYPTLEEAFTPLPIARNRREIIDLINTLPPGGCLRVENEVLKELAEIAIARMGKTLSVELAERRE
jgi:hypothetical protein